MNDPRRPPPPPASSPQLTPKPLPTVSGGWAAALALVGIVTVGVWVWAVSACFDQSDRVDKLASRSFNGPSAVQISQVADQALLRCVAYLAVAGGSTVAFIVIAIWAFSSMKR